MNIILEDTTGLYVVEGRVLVAGFGVAQAPVVSVEV